MKSYRRILVPIFNDLHSNGLLHALLDTVSDQHAQVIVLRLVECNSSFPPDGPAASLPGEIAARRATTAKQNLDLQLARMGLGWVESKVIWRDNRESLLKLIGAWQPDLIIAHRGSLPGVIPDGVDILNTSGCSFFQRLSSLFSPHVPRHA